MQALPAEFAQTMNGNTSLPLLLLYSGLSLYLPPDSTTRPRVEQRVQPLVHKVQELSIEELQQHVARTTISGRTFRAIEAAVPELERRKLRVEDYRIFVYQAGTSLFVLFGSPADNSSGTVVCPGPRACLRVELRADDLRVIGAVIRPPIGEKQ